MRSDNKSQRNTIADNSTRLFNFLEKGVINNKGCGLIAWEWLVKMGVA